MSARCVHRPPPRRRWAPVGLVLALLASACGATTSSSAADRRPPPIVIGGIPDQDLSVLRERFAGIATELEDRVGIPFRYQPSVSYVAVVTAFRNEDVLLAWFGGLTGVQARLAVDGAEAVAQRPHDADFRSVFIVGHGVDVESLEDLAGTTFTFGSESSTSGHLMPRLALRQAGIDPESDLAGRPGYSGSHDMTWKLVETGAFQAGALNETVWRSAVEHGKVDTRKVRIVHTTPPYHDYHWVVHPRIDDLYGEGTTARIVDALLAMRAEDGERTARTLELFDTDRFIPTRNDNYDRIAEVARDLGLLQVP
ncbi:MAG: putative selenate ABC transporter substrate-binding protein [Actinomycetota bacterium]|nr:putative selenate ABC transporter substrate-binding protein [Actinomycetota bacterium]